MSPRERPPLVLTRSDAAKLERIWNDHATTVLGMLKAFCASPEDAQDALQELFLRVGKNIAVVESAKSPRAFLIVSARRIAIDTARKRAADQRRHESPEAAEAVHPSPEPARNDPETAAAISAAVRELPPEQRAVFEAKILQGKTLAVIAAEQSITLNTAASRLRYSLDKIRARLRPHYTAMKNQTNKPNTLTDSPERLIKPLEPKRVPSVIPGLEGVAAMTADDFENICVLPPPEVLDLEETSSAGDIETAGCDPQGGGNAWENFRAPDTVELPLDSTEYSSEPESVIEDNTAEESFDGENLPTEEPLEIATTVEIPEVIICEPFDLSEQPVDEILTGIFEGETPIDPGSEDLVGEDGSLLSCWNYLSAFDGELQVIDDSSGDSGDESGTDDWSDWDLGEYYNDLLKEYDAFLAENPDWITENSGGDMHAQVVTPSIYTGLELADPGAARAFDLWFEKTHISCDYSENSDSTWEEGSGVEFEMQPFDMEQFNNDLLSEYKSFLEGNPDWVASHTGEFQIQLMTSSEYAQIEFGNPGEAAAFDQWIYDTYFAPYEQYQPDSPEVLPVEGGSLNVGGAAYDYGTLLTTDRSGGVPQEVWRGGMQLSGEGTIAVNNGVGPLNPGNLSLNQVPTPVLGGISQTIVTGGTLVSNQPLEGNFTVQKGGTITAGDQTFGEGTYQFSAEETVASRETNATEAPAAAEVVAAASTNQGSATNGIQVPAGVYSSVTPIISGSDSVAESVASPAPVSQAVLDPVELPKLVEAQSVSASEEPSVSDDIAFTDDDSFVPASTELPATASAATPAPAKDDVTAAVGGAFVAGTAAQAAPAKAASIRKAIPLKG